MAVEMTEHGRPCEGSRTLTEEQVERLAALVAARFADIGDPAVRAPLPREYVAERRWSPHNHHDFAVDVDIGATVLTLRIEARRTPEPPVWEDIDLNALSKNIMMHVLLARGDAEGLAQLAAMERTARSKIWRDRSALKLLSVRFQPASPDHPRRLAGRGFRVKVGMLDDLLQPRTALIERDTARGVCHQLSELGQADARRQATLSRLLPTDACLEIEAVAEHAVVAAGLTIEWVVRTMLERRRPESEFGPRIMLSDETGELVSVVARDGRIRLEVELRDLSWTWDRGLVVRRMFPETIMAALSGGPMRRLVEHPLVMGDATIVEVVPKEYYTKILVDRTFRAIGREELRAGAAADVGEPLAPACALVPAPTVLDYI